MKLKCARICQINSSIKIVIHGRSYKITSHLKDIKVKNFNQHRLYFVALILAKCGAGERWRRSVGPIV